MRNKIYRWRKGVVTWTHGKARYFSVVFSWDVPLAKQMIRQERRKCFVGGPAVYQMPHEFEGIAEICYDPPVEPLLFHNPHATFTSRGCLRKCKFCIVPSIEGSLKELEVFRPAPIVCDNNFLACSDEHIERVVEAIRHFDLVDFQGLDARLFNEGHAHMLRRLKRTVLRFALDYSGMKSETLRAVKLAQKHGFKDIRVYVLLGFQDTPEDAIQRLELVRSWGCLPTPQRYQPLGAKIKNSYIAPGWTSRWLADIMRYYSRLNWLGHIPFEKYKAMPEDGLFLQGKP